MNNNKLLDDLLSVLVFNSCSVYDLILNRNQRNTERNSSSLGFIGLIPPREGLFCFQGDKHEDPS